MNSVRSINLLWSLLEKPTSRQDFAINIMQNVIEKNGSEYLEALIADGSDFIARRRRIPYNYEVDAVKMKSEIADFKVQVEIQPIKR